jgi:hypothetical protein
MIVKFARSPYLIPIFNERKGYANSPAFAMAKWV